MAIDEIYRTKIQAAEDRSDFDRRAPFTAPMQTVLRFGHVPPPTETHESATVTAVVNHGRWVAPCPWCASAQLASREDKRFFCIECENRAIEGKWATVVWPEHKADIETVLGMRYDRHTRNWKPTESLGDLLRENESRGVK